MPSVWFAEPGDGAGAGALHINPHNRSLTAQIQSP